MAEAEAGHSLIPQERRGNFIWLSRPQRRRRKTEAYVNSPKIFSFIYIFCHKLPGSEFYDVFFLLGYEPTALIFELFFAKLRGFLLFLVASRYFFLFSCFLLVEEEMARWWFVVVFSFFLVSTECASSCQEGLFFPPSFFLPPPILDSVPNNSFGNTV